MQIFIFLFFCRPSPTRILSTSTTLPRNHLGSDQLYPDEYGGYPNNGGGGGGYFNPLEAMTSSPLRSRQVQIIQFEYVLVLPILSKVENMPCTYIHALHIYSAYYILKIS